MAAFKNLSNWAAEFLKQHVQAHNVEGGDFLSAETVVLVSGPPTLADSADLTTLVPIGLVQNVTVTQQKQLQQLFEIGSRKSFFVPGRTMVSAAISRILFDGPSLMYSLYLTSADGSSNPGTAMENSWTPNDSFDEIELPGNPATSTSVPQTGSAPVDADPGYFFINLASAFFNKPLGLGFVLYDGEKEAYAGFYLEEVYIQQHTFSAAAQQTVLVENTSLRATQVRPLSAESVNFG